MTGTGWLIVGCRASRPGLWLRVRKVKPSAQTLCGLRGGMRPVPQDEPSGGRTASTLPFQFFLPKNIPVRFCQHRAETPLEAKVSAD